MNEAVLWIALIYVSGAVPCYLKHRSVILDAFSEIVWAHGEGVRRKVLIRSVLWFVPASLYYRREIRWERIKEEQQTR